MPSIVVSGQLRPPILISPLAAVSLWCFAMSSFLRVPVLFNVTDAVLAMLCLHAVVAQGQATNCVESYLSPFNSVGCVLFSFFTHPHIESPTAITRDPWAGTIIVADGNNNRVGVFLDNGTFIKLLDTGNGPPFDGPDQGTVDSSGCLYLSNRLGQFVHVFGQYPAYTYQAVIPGFNNSESAASVTIAAVPYVFVSNGEYDIQAFLVNYTTSSTDFTATLVGTTLLPSSDFTYRTGVQVQRHGRQPATAV